MFFAVVPYKTYNFTYGVDPISECEYMYILDTSDWTIERVKFSDIIEFDIDIANIEIWVDDDEYAFVATDLFDRQDLYDWGSNYLVEDDKECLDIIVNGISLSIKVITIDSEHHAIEVCNNLLLEVDGCIEVNYIFYLKSYAVVRFTEWTGSDCSDICWHTAAVGKDGIVHHWKEDECDDYVGTMLDMLSKV